MENIRTIPLEQLDDHPDNSNVMPEALLAKLAGHMQRTGRYPPLIVRPMPGEDPAMQRYQILDGHHRARALRQLGRSDARCVVWDVDDDDATLLLATLNRLEGRDDPHRRASLVSRLRESFEVDELASLLPEQAEQIDHLLTLHDPPTVEREAEHLDDMPVAVHFFLTASEKRALEQALRDVGGSREQALMSLVRGKGAGHG